MAERMTTIQENSWPTKREALELGYTLGYLQATVDIHKMQQQTSGDGATNWLLSRIKVWAERYELVSKLWGMRHRLAWSILIAGWWDYLLWFVRLLLDLSRGFVPH